MAENKTSRELRALKAENAALKAANARLERQITRKKVRWPEFFRRAGVIVLVTFAVVLVMLGNVLFWAGNTVVKTDRYVATVSPVIQQPEVQKAMALYATNQLFDRVDVQGYVQDALPPRADFLAPQLTQQLRTQTDNTLQKALASPKLQTAWNDAQARQHERLITLATNYKGDGTINLQDVYSQLSQQLESTKLSFLADKKLPSSVGSITVVDAPWLPTFHRVVTKIDTWRTLTIVLLVLCLAAAIWLSKQRRRTVYMFSLLTAIAMLATLISFRLGRETLAGSVDPQYAEGVRVAYQTIGHSLVVQTVLVMMVTLLFSLVAWLSGQARSAVAFRQRVVYAASNRVHNQLFGDNTPAFVRWVRRYKVPLEWGVVGVLAFVMLTARLTVTTFTICTVLMIVIVLIIETISADRS